MKPKLAHGRPDDFQTPASAIDPLLPYIPRDWLIWECACGKGNMVRKLSETHRVVGTDILTGQNFVDWQPQEFDCIITNPPYSFKGQFLERAYHLGKPFAFLLPLTTLETGKRQRLFAKYGLEILLLPRRVNFETPSGQGSGSWFATAWFTNGLHLPSPLTFLT